MACSVKEMCSTKKDETISGSKVTRWGQLPHVRKENNVQLHLSLGNDGGPCNLHTFK